MHRYLQAEQGVSLLEALWLEDLAKDQVYEFLFIASPASIQERGSIYVSKRNPIVLARALIAPHYVEKGKGSQHQKSQEHEAVRSVEKNQGI